MPGAQIEKLVEALKNIKPRNSEVHLHGPNGLAFRWNTKQGRKIDSVNLPALVFVAFLFIYSYLSGNAIFAYFSSCICIVWLIFVMVCAFFKESLFDDAETSIVGCLAKSMNEPVEPDGKTLNESLAATELLQPVTSRKVENGTVIRSAKKKVHN